MLRQYLSELRSNALVATASAMPLVGALIRRRKLWFNGKLASELHKIPLNAVLTAIIVVLGLLAVLITPILPLFALGVIAFFLSFDLRATTKFVMMGGFSTALGALTIVDLPHSPITSMRLEGLPFTTTFFSTLNSYTIFGIVAIGIFSLGLKIELTPVQRDTLTALINIHGHERQVVKGEEIAELMDRAPGTIRNQMQSLKALNLVESITGPRGGYKATEAAFEALSLSNSGDGDEMAVPVTRNGAIVKGVSATEITFNNVMNPTHQCNGLIQIIGSIRNFAIGDEVAVGPTPVNKLFIRGKVVGRADTMNRLILNVTEVLSIPRFQVKNIVRRAIRISPEASLREASKMLINNGVKDGLVEGRSPGLINLADIIRAVSVGRTDLKVRDIMTHSFLTINSEELIFEAIKMLGKTGASQLAVLDRGVLWGIITPGDLMESLTPS